MTSGVVVFFGLGAFTWSLLEYVIHRWLGHDRRFKKGIFAKEHIRHHIEGDYFAPSWKKVVFALAIGVAAAPVAALLLGLAHGIAYVTGLLLFYGAYEVLHRREHTSAGIGPYARWARRHHFHHHFENGKSNHGVTSPLWDLVFRTYERPTIIHVPRKLCMSWLRDPATGAIRDEHARTFVLS